MHSWSWVIGRRKSGPIGVGGVAIHRKSLAEFQGSLHGKEEISKQVVNQCLNDDLSAALQRIKKGPCVISFAGYITVPSFFYNLPRLRLPPTLFVNRSKHQILYDPSSLYSYLSTFAVLALHFLLLFDFLSSCLVIAMSSCSSRPQTPIQISLKSPTHSSKMFQEHDDITTVDTSPTHGPNTPISSRQPPAPPTPPDSSSRNNSVNIGNALLLSQSSSPARSLFNSQSIVSRHSSPTNSPPFPSNNVNIRTVAGLTKEPVASPAQQDHINVNLLNPAKNTHLTEANLHAVSHYASNSSVVDFNDHMLPESSCGSLSSATSCQGHDGSDCTSHQTPNVYINGLPPHFPEQELYALTRPFGEVKSVRSFTRHVSEKPTGYGFVLFDKVQSAALCIEGLRKYRNLHPSFSKQVHRIPGTSYASHSIHSSEAQDEETFKARMEKLKDEASTNLYIEGLPLTIDDDTLAALVSPYHIKSSRFFKTKLSDPPRIIAFVRLETRTAADEIIERLHGRMVRGWNDPGCRISVRFADSAEQRELRRAERAARNGDQSPARLTIAQAALLNLRGQEFQNQIRKAPAVHSRGLPAPAHCPTTTGWLPCQDYPAGDLAGMMSNAAMLSSSGALPYQTPVRRMQHSNINHEMATLIDSLQNTMGFNDGVPCVNDGIGMGALEDELCVRALARQAQAQNASSMFPFSLSGGQAQARNGFTPAEELILQTHTRIQQQRAQQQQHPQPSSFGQTELRTSAGCLYDSKIKADIGSRNRGQPFTARPHVQQSVSHNLHGYARSGSSKGLKSALPVISEDEFHVSARHQLYTSSYQAMQSDAKDMNTVPSHDYAANFEPSLRPSSRENVFRTLEPDHPQYCQSRQQGDSISSYPVINLPKQPSTRTALPVHSRSNILPISKPLERDQYATASTRTKNNSTTSNSNNSANTTSNYQSQTLSRDTGHIREDDRANSQIYKETNIQMLSFSQAPPSSDHHNSAYTLDESMSPTAISPALTFSSRTPSTLSPATPFFGSFGNGQEVFETMSEDGEHCEKKLKVRAGTQ
ncbi:hypothetical protein SERLA73DRAFT_69228 [Serpula lacrymans var. lacrymans S7.3]|uniref:RRM domain-containing protein n=2 Tax=Serpula lacrymans var. lacrymans TaxID=341189 RepID=F8PKK8_SERL3|nr:uncharacterized protein SERLADRAFT_433120 [Serpula lacrymans var. lacrymans S7.9]EGO03342.1 hypothetical protein SERLA73DRAFT_69228 [Serpula lacrymans var. lacrymans S7.3]EGO29115.1 hypothetical protein SERLADRAFT_433120 [Serpula lacrymans var. lacrymans S7.9]